MAHVYGHCDFFKNNIWFSQTNRKMIDEMANHGNRIRRYMDRFGVDEVEEFIDACLSIEDLIDIALAVHQTQDDAATNMSFRQRHRGRARKRPTPVSGESYMDVHQSARAGAAERNARQQRPRPSSRKCCRVPRQNRCGRDAVSAATRPAQAVAVGRPLDHARRGVLLRPAGQTKIMNEGWATYWHSTIMTRHGLTRTR
jgi:stage V sporulation protein R